MIYDLWKVLAPVCELCGTHKPKYVEDNYKTWSCKLCTLENNVTLEKYGACDIGDILIANPQEPQHQIWELKTKKRTQIQNCLSNVLTSNGLEEYVV